MVGGSLYKTPNGERLHLALDVDASSIAVALASASQSRPTSSDPRSPANLDGRACTVSVDTLTFQVTAIGIT